jgi:signal transduction histidine kinase
MSTTISARQPRGCSVSDARDRGRRRDAAQWRLVSEASHELRTPLSALRTEVDLALLGDRDAGELRAALRSAAEEIRRVCRLADDMLMLARADHGRLPLRVRPLQPRALLEAAAARARAAARTRGRRMVVRDLAPDRWLLGDPDRAAQALDNLVANALQYGSGTITLTAREDGRLVALHVADQGSGFAADAAARAFQRFSRGRRARGSGSGLGLSLVAAIAIAHRGAATVSNRPEGGADACLALPRWFPARPRTWRPGQPASAGPASAASASVGTVSVGPASAGPASAGAASAGSVSPAAVSVGLASAGAAGAAHPASPGTAGRPRPACPARRHGGRRAGRSRRCRPAA